MDRRQFLRSAKTIATGAGASAAFTTRAAQSVSLKASAQTHRAP